MKWNILFFAISLFSCSKDRPFKVGKASLNGGFRMENFWVWDGSVIQGEDGNFHMFASRWPQKYPFHKGYLHYSEIVRASSTKPEGPYKFEEVVFPCREEKYFDSRMTHNATIHKIGDRFVLFYIGSTYRGPSPTPEQLMGTYNSDAYKNIRIGMATSKSVKGPWERLDYPILAPRQGKWDSTVVTNPAACILADGTILLAYRSNTPEGLRIGIAKACKLGEPFERISDKPIGQFNIEDPYIWYNGKNFEMIAKDMTGNLTDEKHSGVHLVSNEGHFWRVANPPKAYSRNIVWDNNTKSTQGSFERPQLLFINGEPKYLFAATADGQGWGIKTYKTWTMVIPVE